MLYNVDTRGWEANTAWCVPSAVSFLSGIPLIHSHSRAAFIQNKKLKEVRGVYASEAILMLHEQGYRCEQLNLSDRFGTSPTLKKFLDNRTSYEKCMPLMIQVEDNKKFCHMIAAWFNLCADNWTMKHVPMEKFPHLKKYVSGAWIVSKKITPKNVKDAIKLS